MTMWERFTDEAKLVVCAAREEAARKGCDCVEAEHILLGLCRAPGAGTLAAFGIDSESLAREIEERTKLDGAGQPGDASKFAPCAKRALERSTAEARRLEDDSIGTKHILLGLIKEMEGIVAEVLENHIRKGQLDHVG